MPRGGSRSKSSTGVVATYSCGKCNLVDTMEMVQCDHCPKWFHFSCVNVDSGISEKHFLCETCFLLPPITTIAAPHSDTNVGASHINSGQITQNDQTNGGTIVSLASAAGLPTENEVSNQKSKSGKSKSSRSSLALELQRLEEERELQKQRDADYLNKKYKLLQMYDSEDENSVDSDPIDTNQNSISQWLDRSRDVNKNFEPHIGTTTFKKRIIGATNHTQQANISTTSEKIFNCISTTAMSYLPRYSNVKFASVNNDWYQQSQYHVPCHGPQQMHSQPIPSTHQYQDQGRSRSLFNRHDMSERVYNRAETDACYLNKRHIAARQVMPKELPNFNGQPEEWPIFISNYESSTLTCGYTHEENLVRLQKCLKGRALEAVRSRLLIPANVPQVMSTLRMLYGRPDLIINSLLEKIRKEPAPKADRLDTIIAYALSVQNLVAVIESTGLMSHLCNPILLQELTDKLPAQIKLNWAIHKANIGDANISTFGNWLDQIAQAACDVTYAVPSPTPTESKSEKRIFRNKSYVNSHSSTSNEFQFKCKVCQGNCQSVSECKKFVSSTLKERWNIINNNNICRKCLHQHGKYRCKRQNVCGINGCNYKHNQLLHNNKWDNVETKIDDTNMGASTTVNTHHHSNHKILFRTIPITIQGPKCDVKTFAFLDDGSSVTLIEEELVERLGLNGSPQPLCLKWTGNTVREENESVKVDMVIKTVNNKSAYNVQAHSIKSLSLPVQELTAGDISNFNFTNILIKPYENAIPRVLIGIDNLHLMVPLEIREDKDSRVVATKTRLGWAIYGAVKPPDSELPNNKSLSKQSYNMHICECKEEKVKLSTMLKDYFKVEEVDKNKIVESEENIRALKIMNETVKKRNGKFEIGLVWRYDQIKVPDSLPMALRRLDCLNKRLVKDSNLAKLMEKQINDYVSKGYARKLSKDEQAIQQPTWYLPIFPIVNPKKPGKIRMVCDAAAKVGNVSLNNLLIKGPDQTPSLSSILIRFREGSFAICGDIREMYHQVQIRAEDQHAQRFLWNNIGQKSEPDVYVMNVMTFGSTCSPSCAQFIKNKNANEFSIDYPRAVTSIIQNHYVDDMLDSLDSEDEMIKLAKDVKMIHANAGFEIRNWISNSAKVLEAMGENDGIKNIKDLNMNPEVESEKILGMFWNPVKDVFTFSLKFNKTNNDILFREARPTKRDVLRTMMSIFDPLGLLAAFMIFIKILQQEIWRSAIDWDDYINDDHYDDWLIWIRLLPTIEKIQLPRQYFQLPLNKSNIQIHIFTDASEKAYACVAYLRAQYNDEIQCTLIGAKTRVAPLKSLSVPRLELEAAKLGALFAKSLECCLSFKVSNRTFWTDSATVISWLNSDTRKYKQYVACRVGDILECSEISEWRWIPGHQNIADKATKWETTPDVSPSSQWFTGPTFLMKDPSDWPTSQKLSTMSEDLNMVILNSSYPSEKVELISVERINNWKKLLRVVAFVYRFINNIKLKIKHLPLQYGPLQQKELFRAECYLYRLAQSEDYTKEIQVIEKQNDRRYGKEEILKFSPIYKYCPYLDDESVLRSQGRIDEAEVDVSVKRPVILPRKHPITQLIIMHYHQQFHHINHETVVNVLRQSYIIPKLRAALKSVRSNCNKCKRYSARPTFPRMADLPKCRLSPYVRPFRFIGIDYFGPMMVSVGRRSEKKVGCIDNLPHC